VVGGESGWVVTGGRRASHLTKSISSPLHFHETKVAPYKLTSACGAINERERRGGEESERVSGRKPSPFFSSSFFSLSAVKERERYIHI
jgi:hypothetical protein